MARTAVSRKCERETPDRQVFQVVNTRRFSKNGNPRILHIIRRGSSCLFSAHHHPFATTQLLSNVFGPSILS